MCGKWTRGCWIVPKKGRKKIFFFFWWGFFSTILWLLVDMRQPFRRICRWHSERRTFLGGKRMNKNDADSFANWHTPQNSGILFVFLIICLCELAAVTDRLVLFKNNNNKPQNNNRHLFHSCFLRTHIFNLKDVGLCWSFSFLSKFVQCRIINKKKVSPAKWLSVRNTKRERESLTF